MTRFLMIFTACLAIVILSGCDNDKTTATDADSAVTDDAPFDGDAVLSDGDDLLTDTEEISDEDDLLSDTDTGPDFGYNVFFQVMTIFTFGQPMAMSFGTIMKTAREELEPEEAETPLPVDTCEFSNGETETPTPECTSDEECAPEQKCLADTDNNGNPIAGTESCKTSGRASLDRGPVIITGFVGDPATFLFEPNDQVYKKDGTGDGSLDIALLGFGLDYTLAAEGQGDLQPFTGTVHMPPSLDLTYPELTTGGSLPFPSATIDPTKDVLIKWADPNPGEELDLTLTGESGSVVCRVADDGEFVIPVALVSQITFGTGFNAFANNILLSRKVAGTIEGASVTVGAFNAEEMITVMVNAVAGADTDPVTDEDTLLPDN
ncbi:MAG TPA: hypothetical protein PLV42_12345 [bacterium]|nr:hypothetical protein [bacterium]